VHVYSILGALRPPSHNPPYPEINYALHTPTTITPWQNIARVIRSITNPKESQVKVPQSLLRFVFNSIQYHFHSPSFADVVTCIYTTSPCNQRKLTKPSPPSQPLRFQTRHVVATSESCTKTFQPPKRRTDSSSSLSTNAPKHPQTGNPLLSENLLKEEKTKPKKFYSIPFHGPAHMQFFCPPWYSFVKEVIFSLRPQTRRRKKEAPRNLFLFFSFILSVSLLFM
jgi:hypothetical protein